ncbi:MAG: HigA family addiction module antitoxin [Rhodospirillales bacterium]|nr:HigA family addiction module antitoxin [Rhodospirillales bacterium]
MYKRNRAPTHPGILLKEFFIEPNGISVLAFASATGLSRKHLSQIVNGHAAITPDTAVRIAAVIGNTAQFWMNGQVAFDLWHAERKLAEGKPVQRNAFALKRRDEAA